MNRREAAWAAVRSTGALLIVLTIRNFLPLFEHVCSGLVIGGRLTLIPGFGERWADWA
jgi:hypothetical protein